jgi:hypothetical protein
MFSGGKGGRCVGLTTLPPSCADCLKIWETHLLEPSGPVKACNGIALPFTVQYNTGHYSTVQYMFTHKQYTEYTERNIHNNKKEKKLGSAGRAPSLRFIPWHLPYN